MAKLVDALCSGRSARKGVLVRIQFWAPTKQNPALRAGFSYLGPARATMGPDPDQVKFLGDFKLTHTI